MEPVEGPKVRVERKQVGLSRSGGCLRKGDGRWDKIRFLTYIYLSLPSYLLGPTTKAMNKFGTKVHRTTIYEFYVTSGNMTVRKTGKKKERHKHLEEELWGYPNG